jgi:hypothetical protein
MAPER